MATIVGRDRELAAVASFLDASEAGILLLAGEAGIGKTTLWREAVRSAGERGFRVLTASATQSETGLGLATIGDLLGDAFDAVAAQLPAPQARALAVALWRRDAAGAPPDPATIAVAVLSTLRKLAEQERVAVALDDVQWLDTPSAAALGFALRRLQDDDVVFVLAQRLDGSPQLPLGLDRFPEGSFARVEVGPLSPGALHSVVAQRAGRAFSRPALQRLHAESRGNPFYAIEIAHALGESAEAFPGGSVLPVPQSLDELLAARLAALPEPTLEALEIAACLHEPTLDLVAAALDADDVTRRLEPAFEAQLAEVRDKRLAFSHPLFASSVYARVGRLRRLELHRRLAALAPSGEERARHLAASRERPDPEVAEALDDAARAAGARGARATAAEFADMAAGFTPADAAEAALRRRCEAAESYLLAGDPARARAVAARVVSDTEARVERARSLLVMSFTDILDMDAGIALAEQALREAEAVPELAARVNHWLGVVWLVRASLERAGAHAAAAAATPTSGAIRGQALSLAVLVDVLAGRRPDEGTLEQALAIEGDIDGSMFYGPSTVLAVSHLHGDRIADAREAFAAALSAVLDRGDEQMAAALMFHQTELECRAGDFERAARHADAGYQLSMQIGIPDRLANQAYCQALVHAHAGNVESARAKADEALAIYAGTGTFWEVETRTTLGFLELSLGDVAAAEQQLRGLPERLLEMGYGAPLHLQAFPNAIEALAALGRLSEARHLLAQYVEAIGRSPSAYGRSLAARSDGVLAAAEGETVRALDLLDEALREAELARAPVERARTLLLRGRVERRAGQRRAARESLAAAQAAFEELGASRWAERAQDELARIGGRTVTSGSLTHSERRIADLVAEGKTNKEVAELLVISHRTVESALSQIYRKLDVRSRTELARKLTADA